MTPDDLMPPRDGLTAGAAARLVADWRAAGEPEDVFGFLASTSPWRDLPVGVFAATFEAMRQPLDEAPGGW